MTTAALTIILAFFGPLSGLSSEDYNTREASQAAFTRLSALTLPNDHENPEARRRILEIRLTHCPHVFPLLAERRLRLTDPAEWIEKHVVSGESLLGSKDDIFLMFHAEGNQQLGRVCRDVRSGRLLFIRRSIRPDLCLGRRAMALQNQVPRQP